MLILTRRVGETIRIGDEITLKVVNIQGLTVRLAVQAPEQVEIWREELYEARLKRLPRPAK